MTEWIMRYPVLVPRHKLIDATVWLKENDLQLNVDYILRAAPRTAHELEFHFNNASTATLFKLTWA